MVLWFHLILGAWWVLLSVILFFRYAFLSPSLYLWAIDIIPSWPHLSLPFVGYPLDSPLMCRSVPWTCLWCCLQIICYPPSRLPHFRIIIFPCRLVLPLMLRVELLKIWLTCCLHIVHIFFVLPFKNISPLQTVELVTSCPPPVWIVVSNLSWFQSFYRSCSLCNFVKYTAMYSSGFHRNSVSFHCSFLSVFDNDRRCLLRC